MKDSVPVLVGFGQVTLNDEMSSDVSAAFVIAEAAKMAMVDTGLDLEQVSLQLEGLVVIDTMHRSMDNLPGSVADLLEIKHARQRLAPVSGHIPQVLINRICAEISNGKSRATLIAGGEALRSARALIRGGKKPFWEGVAGTAEPMFERKPFATEHEREHGIWLAKDVYPLYETSLRSYYGNSVEQHGNEIGEIWSSLSRVAAQNEYAWFRNEKSPADVISTDSGNRLITYPYTKTMNAMNQVDQGGAVLIMSQGEAKSMGIDPSKWIYMHAAAEADEHGFTSQRVNYHSSPAISAMGESALSTANIQISDVDYIDLYSCFPCAVEIARDALGIQKTDSRPLTVTGGLSFNGGPGGSYVLTALATMAKLLRAEPESIGLITANGGLLAEHAMGIYSTAAPKRTPSYDRAVINACQSKIDSLNAPELDENPCGLGVVEAYSVVHGKHGGPKLGIVIGRLVDLNGNKGSRFLANTPESMDLFEEMESTEFVGRSGLVTRINGINVFDPECSTDDILKTLIRINL